jgi:hypothetical protein
MKEDWQVKCPKCGRSKLYSEMGGVRQGAYSKGKRLFGWCKGCNWFRWGIVEKVLVNENGTIIEPNQQS